MWLWVRSVIFAVLQAAVVNPYRGARRGRRAIRPHGENMARDRCGSATAQRVKVRRCERLSWAREGVSGAEGLQSGVYHGVKGAAYVGILQPLPHPMGGIGKANVVGAKEDRGQSELEGGGYDERRGTFAIHRRQCLAGILVDFRSLAIRYVGGVDDSLAGKG